jgi:hypothetical protein
MASSSGSTIVDTTITSSSDVIVIDDEEEEWMERDASIVDAAVEVDVGTSSIVVNDASNGDPSRQSRGDATPSLLRHRRSRRDEGGGGRGGGGGKRRRGGDSATADAANRCDENDNRAEEDEECEFRNSPYHLRISASSVSALCGLHPYQDLPNLLFDLVYQSRIGQRLLRIDASALGLALVDARDHERETMMHLAGAASSETRDLVAKVLEVSDGTRMLDTVDDVRSMRESIRANAIEARRDGRLSADQVETLLESTRGHLTTSFGTHHEDDALNIYETKFGSRVRERNEALMEWHFRRVVVVRDGENDDVDDAGMGVTAAPMGDAIRRCWKRRRPSGDEIITTGANDDGKADATDRWRTTTAHVDPAEATIGNDAANVGISSFPPTPDEEALKPFFKIVGAVDGIRDELYVESSRSTTTGKSADGALSAASASSSKTSHDRENVTNQRDDATNIEICFSDDDEDDWTLRPIIVECKHRMNEAKVPPPLYDQIQTCLYCRMYNVADADLVQVIRRKRRREGGNEIEDEKEPGDGKKSKARSIAKSTSITVTRISLNDPIYNHDHHWKATLLPRLASFVDAVYNVRKDDGKRYRLLMARSEDVGDASGEEAWRLLWEECPWLRHCDTAFAKRRRFSSSSRGNFPSCIGNVDPDGLAEHSISSNGPPRKW